MGLFEENGPVIWEIGTQAPIQNPWSWHLLSNIVYIEQPVGVGFSHGHSSEDDLLNEELHAKQFLGFWKNFVDTFSLHGYKVYITVESYGGVYGPYIGSQMLEANDTRYYDVDGLLIYNGLIHDITQIIQTNVPIADFVEQNANIYPLRRSQLDAIRQKAKDLGFTDYLCRYLKFPPTEAAPRLPPGVTEAENGTLVVDEEHAQFYLNYVSNPMWQINPCYNMHEIGALCPYRIDPLTSLDVAYFNRTEVKTLLNVEDHRWTVCNVTYLFSDAKLPLSRRSPAPDLHQLPHVIDRTQNVLVVHGVRDAILSVNGLLLGIQNMTWGGMQGFQTAPKSALYVPLYGLDYDSGEEFYAEDRAAGAGVLGTTHEERGLTLALTTLSGHEGPGYSAASSFRHIEKLLRRVESLSEVSPFTLPQLKNIKQLEGDIGDGTYKVPSFGSSCKKCK